MAISGRQYDWEDAAAVSGASPLTDGDSRRSVTPAKNRGKGSWR